MSSKSKLFKFLNFEMQVVCVNQGDGCNCIVSFVQSNRYIAC